MSIELLDDAGKVRKGARQAIHFVDHDHLNAACRHFGEQTLQARTLHRSPGVPTVLINGRVQEPAFMRLTLDEGFTRFALRMQRVEILL